MQGSATTIPLVEDRADTLVMTWMLCSIPDRLAPLGEMRRAPTISFTRAASRSPS
jgi:hypothetical protein